MVSGLGTVVIVLSYKEENTYAKRYILATVVIAETCDVTEAGLTSLKSGTRSILTSAATNRSAVYIQT